MPFVYQQNINLQTRLGVWHITEEEEFFNDVTVQRWITHPKKRLQHLAGRHLLRELYPDFPLQLIKIADTRKPFLEDDPFHFSISHCDEYAAAIVSRESRVGVDIEVPSKKIINLQHKFLGPGEPVGKEANAEDILTLCWSIKESVYKWYGSGGVDFKKHINILSIDSIEGLYHCRCIFTKELAELEVKAIRINNNWLTWIVT